MPFTPTYTYQNIVDYVQRLVKGIPVADIDEICVDQIDAIFWGAYPWRWVRGILTSISLVDGTQDYSYSNANLWKPLSIRITNTQTTPNQYRDLTIVRWLEPYLISKTSWPQFRLICHDLNQDKFRLEGAVALPSGAALRIDGEYWKQHTKITNLATTIVFPDFYFNVLAEGLLWLLYRFADDERAGQAELIRGQVVYTGQLGVFIDAMVKAKENEESGIGDTIYPEDPLGADQTGLSLPTMFNF